MSSGSFRPRVLLLDLDGVLRQWPVSDADIERRHGLAPGALRSAAFDPVLLRQVVTGRIDDAEWRSRVRRVLGAAVGEDAAAGAVRDWSASAGTVDADVLALVDHSGLDVVLATNATSRLAEDLERVGLHDRFRHVVNSSDLGAAKPDADFFAAALARAGVSAAEAVFVDDSSSNVRAAAAMGIRSHVFAGVPGLRRFLDEVVSDPHDGP